MIFDSSNKRADLKSRDRPKFQKVNRYLSSIVVVNMSSRSITSGCEYVFKMSNWHHIATCIINYFKVVELNTKESFQITAEWSVTNLRGSS